MLHATPPGNTDIIGSAEMNRELEEGRARKHKTPLYYWSATEPQRSGEIFYRIYRLSK